MGKKVSGVVPVKNVFSIPSHVPFLRRLARFVLDQTAANAPPTGDPLALSNTTIYLPTRRAVRALKEEFSDLLGPDATFLPRFRTLGDEDEEGLEAFLPAGGSSDPVRTIDGLTRQIELARLVKRWVEILGDEARELFEDEDIIIPTSSAESLWLAKEIGELIDQMEREEISWDRLNTLVSNKDTYANWWQLTLDFLQIAMKSWPLHLSEIGACDPVTRRRMLLDIRTRQLQQFPPSGPVIAAGSTGSIPATARFLKAIAELPNGAVILPGLDMHISDDVRRVIFQRQSTDTPEEDFHRGCEDHPQYGMAVLLDAIGVSPDEVEELERPIPVAADAGMKNRSRLISIALLPSEKTDQWRALRKSFSAKEMAEVTANITLIEAPAERQEALAIALVMRKQIAAPDTRTALVTPDRNLARRVAAELRRFDLNIDDSGGRSLANSPNAIFIRMLISVATQSANAVLLASFVKHPFFAIDVQPDSDAHSVGIERLFEICLLRDAIRIPQPGEFARAIREYRQKSKTETHLPPRVKRMAESDWDNLISFCAHLDGGLAPVSRWSEENRLIPVAQLFESIIQAAQLLSSHENNVFGDEAGIELAGVFEEIANGGSSNFSCRADELPQIFDALIAGRVVREGGNIHPRISILGPLEARLQKLDCVILGGLNEGTWPALQDSGPFLNRPMRTAMELTTPERRTGLAAHDFEQLLGCAEVFLSRAQRVDNTPTVASRWLQRLGAVCGAETNQQMSARGVEYLELANLLDDPGDSKSVAERVERPCPKPALQYRPNGLSLSDVETWIRDPYAIYAKHILKLRPLGTLGKISEPMLRGNLLHEAVAEFVQAGNDPSSDNATEILEGIVEEAAKRMQLPDHIVSLWMPRFGEVIGEFIAYERKRKSLIVQSHCEIDGRMFVGDSGFQLRARADRIDVLGDGSADIIDYKTGTNPSAKMARTLSPQLALEGAIVMAGGFEAVGRATPSQLQYIRLRARGEFKSEAVNTGEENAEQLSNRMLKLLEHLVSAYQEIEQGYISRFAVAQENNLDGDYDHLARVREWSLGGEEGEND